MRGGLFVSRAEALRYAVSEADYCLQAIVMADGFVELDLRDSPKVAANGTKPPLGGYFAAGARAISFALFPHHQ
jgi:hypothetical protein